MPLPYKHQRWCLKGNKSVVVVHCQSSGNVVKSGGVSSVLTERSKLVSDDHGKGALMDAGTLVLSTNGNEVKDLVPYGGPAKSLVEMDDGIGIVKYLRGKSFLITGATGFLAKGTFFHFIWPSCRMYLTYVLVFLNLIPLL